MELSGTLVYTLKITIFKVRLFKMLKYPKLKQFDYSAGHLKPQLPREEGRGSSVCIFVLRHIMMGWGGGGDKSPMSP